MTSHFEQTEKGLETVLQSASKGQMLFEDLRKFSFSTTFGIDELASASTQLLNVGVSQNNLKDQLRMLGDLAQGDKTKFAELTAIVAKIESTGKAGAMQLNQLALRGIPIKKVLEEMGVTGVATADQINQAFEKMTSAGGQFHNAMGNIIDTIEGKRGFISDTLKEIQVNFSALSGLTDAYKSMLDNSYNVLNAINNALREMNENPVMKAIVQGVMVSVLTTLAGIIGVGLAIALKTVIGYLATIIGQMTIIQTLSGVVGWITLAVGAIAGLGVGIASYVKNVKEANESTKDWGTTVTSFIATNNEYVQVLDEVEHKVKSINDIYNEMSEGGTSNDVLDSMYSRLSSLKSRMETMETGETEGSLANDRTYNKLKAEYESLNELFEKQVISQRTSDVVQASLLKKENERKRALEEQNKLYEQQLATVESIYKKTQNGQLEDLQNQIDTYQKIVNQNGFYNYENKNGRMTLNHIKLTSEEKKYYETAINELKDQKKKILDEMKLKSLLEEDGGWRKIMQDALGLTDKQVTDGALDNGGKAVNDYLAKIEKINADSKTVNSMLGVNNAEKNKNVISEQIGTVMQLYNTFIKSGKFGLNKDGTLDNTTQALKDALDRLKQEFINAGGTVSEFDSIVGNTTNGIKDKLKDMFTSVVSGTDVGTFASSFKESGDWKTALLDTFIASLTDVIGGLDGLETVLSPISFLLQGIAPFLQMMVNILSVVYEVLEPFVLILADLSKIGTELVLTVLSPVIQILKVLASVLKLVYEILSPFLNVIALLIKSFQVLLYPLQMLVKAINKAIEWLAQFSKKLKKAINDASTSIDDMMDTNFKLAEQQETEADRLKKINEQYKSLLQSLKEQEEYYLEQKKIINADTYKQGAMNVNDMIITPHGNFSTAPDDYIMAMKNPSSLGNVTMNVQINNTMSESAQVDVEQTTNKDGMQELIVSISRKVADDYATGKNGWKNAYNYRMNKIAGRSVQ